MKNTKRLSIEDFKLKKLEGKIDAKKSLGGIAAVAADCHTIVTTYPYPGIFTSDPAD